MNSYPEILYLVEIRSESRYGIVGDSIDIIDYVVYNIYGDSELSCKTMVD